MRKRFPVLVAGAVAGLFGVALVAQDAPPEEYSEAMQNIRAAAQAFGQLNESQDFDGAAEAAEAARDAFLVVEQFWKERGDSEAVELAARGAKTAGDALAAAGLRSAEGVAFAAMQMGETCGTCHMAHRDRLEDGSFVIM